MSSTHTHDPATYEALNVPLTLEEADARLNEFMEDLREIRRKHGIADVHVITRCVIKGGGPALGSIHLGAVQEAEGMAAWAFARAGEERRHFVNNMKSAGIASSRG